MSSEKKTYKVLVVDDESWIRRNIQRILENEGIKVILADSGQAALTLLSQEKVDLVLTDHRMPRMTGIELLEVVKQKYPDVSRMVVTGFADLQLALDAINKVEIHRMLLKPYSRGQMVSAVRELLELRAESGNVPALDLARARKAAMEDLRDRHPGIQNVERDRMGRVIIDHDGCWDTKKLWKDVADILGPSASTKQEVKSAQVEDDDEVFVIKIP